MFYFSNYMSSTVFHIDHLLILWRPYCFVTPYLISAKCYVSVQYSLTRGMENRCAQILHANVTIGSVTIESVIIGSVTL